MHDTVTPHAADPQRAARPVPGNSSSLPTGHDLLWCETYFWPVCVSLPGLIPSQH